MAVERKETEKLVDELMKMNIPAYEPSANHIQLSNTGIISRYTKIIVVLQQCIISNSLPAYIDIHIANINMETRCGYSLVYQPKPSKTKQQWVRETRLAWIVGNAFTKIQSICIRRCQYTCTYIIIHSHKALAVRILTSASSAASLAVLHEKGRQLKTLK